MKVQNGLLLCLVRFSQHLVRSAALFHLVSLEQVGVLEFGSVGVRDESSSIAMFYGILR